MNSVALTIILQGTLLFETAHLPCAKHPVELIIEYNGG